MLAGGCCAPAKLVSGQEGVFGVVSEVRGNMMPGPGRTLPPPAPIQTTVFAYEATTTEQVDGGPGPLYTAIRTKLVDSVVTDDKGAFKLPLPPGRYSFFVRVDGKYFANLFDDKNMINAVTVAAEKYTELNITVNDKAHY